MTIAVVITLLGPKHLVAGTDHGYPLAQKKEGHEIFCLLPSETHDLRIIRFAFYATVPACVFIASIPIVLPVRLVMLFIVADEVSEGETIVARYEIDAVYRKPAFRFIEVAAACDPCCDFPDQTRVAPDKAPHHISVPAVPLGPAVSREIPDLIETACIPCFCDKSGVAEDVGEFDMPGHGCVLERFPIVTSCEYARKIEAKAVNVHLPDPVLQAGDQEGCYNRKVAVYRVAAARVIPVGPEVVGIKVVKASIAESFEIDRRPVGAPFGGVVQDNVQYHPDTGTVEGLYHIAKLASVDALLR
ncbi:MAG: hypothetical protein A4E63_01406 [Syntrophorhabdus sp. PtaU1.Bin050]|nr:MAG: hypothetical protein A4E63_01406 [Syntrophorhabdus sp. PtaU1.Bin050]